MANLFRKKNIVNDEYSAHEPPLIKPVPLNQCSLTFLVLTSCINDTSIYTRKPSTEFLSLDKLVSIPVHESMNWDGIE